MNTPTPRTDAESFVDGPVAGSGAELIAAEICREMERALRKVREDINWMLNNRKFLNPDTFDYIDAALKDAN